MTYRILSIDGGGVRGLLVTVLLQRLAEESTRPNFLSQIDLFAGTSTGAIVALGLANGYSPEQGRRLYREKLPLIFADSLWDDLKDLGFAVGAKYSNKPLREVLAQEFGATRTLNDLQKNVLISSFDLDDEGKSVNGLRCWKPKFFHNYPGEDSDGDEYIVDVALRSAAAPTMFPVFQGFVDGGVSANNPSMCAVAQALDPRAAAQETKDIVLFSLGTGSRPSYLPTSEDDQDWGWKQWAVRLNPSPDQKVELPLLEMVIDGMVQIPDFQCQQILKSRYHRLQTILPEPIGLDDVGRLDRLVEIGYSVDLTETIAWIDEYF